MADKLVFNATTKSWVTLNVEAGEPDNIVLSNKTNAKRNLRDQLLKDSDWTMTFDSPLTDSQKDEAKTYRQSLRDLPAHNEFPNNTFPTKPNFIK